MIKERRILYLFNAFVDDGPGRVTFALAGGVQKAGAEVRCAAWSRGGPLNDAMAVKNMHPVVLERSALRLAALINEFRPDIVHAILVRPNIGLFFSRLFSIRYSFIWVAGDHGVHEWDEKGRVVSWLMRKLFPIVLNQAFIVATVSEAARQELVRAGVVAQRIHVLPNGVDVRRYRPRGRDEREAFIKHYLGDQTAVDDVVLVGTAGNLRHLKGYDILVNAAAKVASVHPQVRFVIWGEGPELAMLRELAQNLGVSDIIKFCGYEPELETRFPLLDIYVQPSRIESFGLAAAEAMACKLPVIVSERGGLGEIVDHGRVGLMFKGDNPDDLAGQITSLAENPERRAELADLGRQRILKNYTADAMIDAATSCYQSLLEAKGR